jgi:hypothetical protein
MTFSGGRALHCDIRIHDSKKLSNIKKYDNVVFSATILMCTFLFAFSEPRHHDLCLAIVVLDPSDSAVGRWHPTRIGLVICLFPGFVRIFWYYSVKANRKSVRFGKGSCRHTLDVYTAANGLSELRR